MKCENCRKSLKVISFDCKCGKKVLCTGCLPPTVHQCTYNYHMAYKNVISAANPIIVADKFEKI
jgi:hypothetical protein